MAPSYSFEDRISQLIEFESEHGHLFVPQSLKEHGLGKYVNNVRRKKKNGELKADMIEALDGIGFVWVVPKGQAKEELIEWGKNFKWVVDFKRGKGHCNVPSKIAGRPVPAAAWCDEQRQLHMDGKLDKSQIDKLTNIGFDFYGSCEDEPVSDSKIAAYLLCKVNLMFP